jgi:TonB family protein
VYPQMAKAQGIQGVVLLEALIGKDGHVSRVDVLDGPKMLQQSALDAVRQWVYSPFLIDGKPVEVDTLVTTVFSLSR